MNLLLNKPMARKLRCLNIYVVEADKLARKDIRQCKDVLSRSEVELLRLCDCSFTRIKSLVESCSEAVAPKVSNALLLWQASRTTSVNYMSTCLPALDKLLHGGLPVGTITEITGPPGSGKTQFCLMLSSVEAAARDGGVIYIDTEGSFSAKRLMEIMQARCPNMESYLIEIAMKRVHVVYAQTCLSLKASIESIEELIISKNVKLVLIDSIASLMRKEFSSASQSIIERTNLLTKLASTLKYTAEFFKIPVVATNQTTTQIQYGPANFNPQDVQQEDGECRNDDDDDDDDDEPVDTKGQGELIAALGNTWSHSVNTRLILQYLAGGGSSIRQVLVAKSPVSGFGAVTCSINREGIVQCDEDAKMYSGTNPGLQRIVSKGQFPSIPDSS